MGGNAIFCFFPFNIPWGQGISFSPFTPLFKDQGFILNETGISFSSHAIGRLFHKFFFTQSLSSNNQIPNIK